MFLHFFSTARKSLLFVLFYFVEKKRQKIMEFTYKMQYKFDAVEEGEMNCKQGQLVTSDSECLFN